LRAAGSGLADGSRITCSRARFPAPFAWPHPGGAAAGPSWLSVSRVTPRFRGSVCLPRRRWWPGASGTRTLPASRWWGVEGVERGPVEPGRAVARHPWSARASALRCGGRLAATGRRRIRREGADVLRRTSAVEGW